MKNTKVFLTKSKIGSIKIKELTLHVAFDEKIVTCRVVTKTNIKNFTIRINSLGEVIVNNPYYPISKVEAILNEKARWIVEKTAFVKQRKSIQTLLCEEGKILYLGEKISLHVKSDLDTFYKEHTKSLVEKIVEEQSFIMGVKPTAIRYRKAKKRWGSCSGKNELSFNISLCQLPLNCITYIVIHELAHIKHKHHKKTFWQFVLEHMPEYKMCEKTLKQFTPTLS
ncbi:MAG: DUF45 domain-containing protein [Sulfurospirillaceae bacterium]|nr:DUF45 domain-containing protein [Sulfurospirillaceae bacterium]